MNSLAQLQKANIVRCDSATTSTTTVDCTYFYYFLLRYWIRGSGLSPRDFKIINDVTKTTSVTSHIIISFPPNPSTTDVSYDVWPPVTRFRHDYEMLPASS